MTDEAWIDTVRLARDFGTVAELLPEGFTDIRDMPHRLFGEIREALIVLNWEELPKEEQPPRAIWDDGLKLKQWFREVEMAREQKYGAGANSRIEGDVSENPAAAELRHALRG